MFITVNDSWVSQSNIILNCYGSRSGTEWGSRAQFSLEGFSSFSCCLPHTPVPTLIISNMFEPNQKVCGMPRLEQRCEDWIFRNLNAAKQSAKISVYFQRMRVSGGRIGWFSNHDWSDVGGCLTLKLSHISCWLKLFDFIWLKMHTQIREARIKPESCLIG